MGKFVVLRHRNAATGETTKRIPLFSISEAFATAHALKLHNKVHVTNDMPMAEVNTFVVSQQSQIKKELVSIALKSFVARLGDVLSSGKKVNVDLGGMGTIKGEHAIVEYVPNSNFVEEFQRSALISVCPSFSLLLYVYVSHSHYPLK